MKKALMIASVASMIDKFNMDNIELLRKQGYKVDVAANFDFGSITSQERVNEFKQELVADGIDVYNIHIPRKILDIKGIVNAYKNVNQLSKTEDYALVHCHSPIGGVITRLAFRRARKNGTKVLYTAHGFHFYKGAPFKNWLIYYPVEWICSFFTDVLITINNEDYNFAKKHMHAKKIKYIPGVGIDTEKIVAVKADQKNKREEIGIPNDCVAVLSIGELNDNKNHETILKAIASLGRKDITYVICGLGNKKEYLQKLAKTLGIADNLILKGYRKDIAEICKCCDIFAFPSKREGLGLAALEAMAANLPLITSNIHGIPDYSKDGITGFACAPNDIKGFAKSIEKFADDKKLRDSIGAYNVEAVKKFDIKNIRKLMEKIYIDK